MATKKPLHPPRIVDPRSTPFAPIKYRGTLPHIFKDGCTYFVTFCLADVAPIRQAERRRMLEEETPEKIAGALDVQDRVGSCVLGMPEPAAEVESTLLHFQGQRYALSAWCVMPNHVHAVVTPLDHSALPTIVQAWKSVSAHRVNNLLDRDGRLWQRETFDHIVRDESSFERFIAYTENNPVVAGFVEQPEDWVYSSARFRGERL